MKATEEVTTILNDVTTGIKKVTDLVSEVAAASNEQAQGISQVNTAVTQIDQVTQQNASNAEESASASEEMSAQAQQLQNIVGDLTALVKGSRDQEQITNRSIATTHHNVNVPAHDSGLHTRLSGLKDKAHNVWTPAESKKAKTITADKETQPKAEEVIPLREDEKQLAEF